MDDLNELLRGIESAASYQAGIGVAVREFVRRMRFVETLDEMLEWDAKQCQLSPGTRIMAMVMAILEDRRALFRMPEVYAYKDVELLLGEGVRADWLNDKALARALDKLQAADARRVYSSICLQAMATYEVVAERLHADTTSVSVYGRYPEEGSVDITFGFSKDHRPDLRQFKVGATVTDEGIPITGDVFDGNRADQKWNADLLRWLQTFMAPERRPAWSSRPVRRPQHS